MVKAVHHSVGWIGMFLCAILILLTSTKASSQTEKIISFHVDLQLSADNKLVITENIKVYAAGNEIRRGIYRALPINPTRSEPNKKVKYKILSISQDGKEADYHTEFTGDQENIYIGSEDIIIPHGEHTYTIKYQTSENVGFFKDYDELYWNVTGNYWHFPIDSASATLHLPEAARILQSKCYSGSFGSSESNCQSSRISPTEISWSALNLFAGQGLTIAAGFSKHIITPPPPPTYWERNGLLIFSIFVILFLLVYYYNSWTKHGKDPESPTIYPQFDIPENLTPAALGYIQSESISNEYISASIINLSVKGYIKISQSEESSLFGLIKNKHYVLKKIKDSDADLAPEEEILMRELFSYDNSFTLDGQYDPTMKSMVTEYKTSLKNQYGTLVKKGNNLKFVLVPMLILIISIVIVAIFDAMMVDRESPLFIIAIFGVAIMFTMSLIVGYYMAIKKALRWIVIIVDILILLALFNNFNHSANSYLVHNIYAMAILLIFGIVSLNIYLYLIRQPSPEKLKLQSLIKGFDMYIGAAEEEQIKFFNPPKMTPEIFEKFLPYAIVLGVDKIWGKKFQQLLESSSIDPSQYHSSWYTGSFISPSAFTSSLSSSFTQAISSASSPPSSSGSGGGGFSGGGGGGGGGGGW